MKPLVFLDIDGVLNTHEFDSEVMCGQIHKDKVERLNRILRATGANIVLSSAWRYLIHRGEMNLMGMEWLFRSHGILADRLIGITRPDTMVREVYRGDPGTWPLCNERGKQISDWLIANPGWGSKYVVIDDGGKDRSTGEWTDLGIRSECHPVVFTVGCIGIMDDDVTDTIEILRNGGRRRS